MKYNDFERWFYSRGEFYKTLPIKYYSNGEPYFSSQGAECTLRDYLRRKDMVKDIFTCIYVSGGGTEHDGGIWQKQESPKTIVFKQIKESFYQPNWTVLKIYKDGTRNKRHAFRDWRDNTYTIYPDQCGTPHLFEAIEAEKIEEAIKLIRPKKCIKENGR